MTLQAQPRDPGERRRRVITAAAIMLMLMAGAAVTAASTHSGPPRPVDLVRDSGLLLLALVIALRATTSFTLLKRNAELDDELSRATRAGAARAGYWALLIAIMAAFVASLFIELPLPQIAPLLLAVGAAGAGLRFAVLESRGG
ncbi:MAG TPA: hypothetical protein VG943_09275 [Caulobacterales bacterium]|nr:hypothetical protein [Caulobacterales bacterium]